MKTILFALFVVLIVGSCYWIGLETGTCKGWDKGYWRGMMDSWYKTEVFETRTLKDKWVRFRASHVGIHWDAVEAPELDEYLKEKDSRRQTNLSSTFLSGATTPELQFDRRRP